MHSPLPTADRRRIGIAIATCSAILVVRAPLVFAQTVNACAAKKLSCVGATVSSVQHCYGAAAGAGESVDDRCLEKASAKLTDSDKGCFAKAERKDDCLTVGGAAALATTVGGFAVDAATAIEPGFPTLIKDKCAARKNACVAATTKSLLACHAKAARKGALDPACIQAAHAVLDGGARPEKGCFAKLDAKLDCPKTGTVGDLETLADAFVAATVCVLDPASPGCGAAVTPTPTITSPATPTAALTTSPSPTASVTSISSATPTTSVTPISSATPTASTTATASVTATASATRTATPIAATPTRTATPVPTSTATVTPQACPSEYEITFDGTDADQDLGWTGATHDEPMTSNVRLTMDVDCASSTAPCGTCTLSGPVLNSGGTTFANQRCRGTNVGADGSWITCTSNADCPGTGNACVFFAGPPEPLGPFSACIVSEVAGPITGTLDVGSGAAALGLALHATYFLGESTANPCPRCVAGTCTGGARNGSSCVVNGTSALFGADVSLDCPPSAIKIISSNTLTTTLATGSQALTLGSDSPACTGNASLRCFCQTCNDAAATPCRSNADCVTVGATVCGGSRCVGGSNAGTPCTAASQCPQGSCRVPGQVTLPNQCTDGTCTPNTPPDEDSVNEGVCAAGPLDHRCTLDTFRTCTTNGDCPRSGDTCGTRPRECFTDDGVVGQSIFVSGIASPTAPTFGGFLCVGITSNATLNQLAGFPGPGRVTLPASAVMR